LLQDNGDEIAKPLASRKSKNPEDFCILEAPFFEPHAKFPANKN
jgi:hypothetical protein